MSFSSAMDELLPADLPERQRLVDLGARHLDLIVEANQSMNLTRIISQREAVIKHVLDSVLPWRLFASAETVADAGTGAGYPGIPLAVILPQTHFLLIEATQKKARFVETVVASLGLQNVQVLPVRIEDWLRTASPQIVTARAMAPLERAVPWLAPAIRQGGKALLYKGPDLAAEIAAATREMKKAKVQVEEVLRYDLPEQMGMRTIAQVVQGK